MTGSNTHQGPSARRTGIEGWWRARVRARGRANGLRAASAPAAIFSLAVVAAISLAVLAAATDITTVRIAWDPSRDPRVVGYRVYSGTRPGVYTATRDVWYRTSYDFEGMPGTRYYFAVAAFFEGPVVGARSREVSGYAMVRLSQQDEPAAPIDTAGTEASLSSARTAVVGEETRLCFDAPADRCLTVTTLASSVGDVSTIAYVPNGDLLFAEGGQRVRVITGGDLLDESLLTVGASTRVAQIVVDPAFARSGFVYVALLDTRLDDVRELSVVRYRLVQQQFGERATIVAGLPVTSLGDAPIAIDLRGHLYVALPGSNDGARGLADLGGTVLRLNTDGSLPRDNPTSSPVLALGYEHPVDLEWNEADQTLWMSGSDSRGRDSVSFLTMTPPTNDQWPRVPRPAPVEVSESAAREPQLMGIVALDPLDRPGPSPGTLLLAPVPRARVLTVQKSAPSSVTRAVLHLDKLGMPSAVAVGPDAQVYAGLRWPGAPGRSRIVKLQPLPTNTSSP